MNDDGMWQRLPKRICLQMIVTDMYQRLPKSICAKPLPNYWFCDSIFLFTGCEPLPHHRLYGVNVCQKAFVLSYCQIIGFVVLYFCSPVANLCHIIRFNVVRSHMLFRVPVVCVCVKFLRMCFLMRGSCINLCEVYANMYFCRVCDFV